MVYSFCKLLQMTVYVISVDNIQGWEMMKQRIFIFISGLKNVNIHVLKYWIFIKSYDIATQTPMTYLSSWYHDDFIYYILYDGQSLSKENCT